MPLHLTLFKLSCTSPNTISSPVTKNLYVLKRDVIELTHVRDIILQFCLVFFYTQLDNVRFEVRLKATVRQQ